jgi:hypothetical protein
MYQPSFSLILVGKIPRKYQPIPTKNTESQNNSIKEEEASTLQEGLLQMSFN